MKVKEKTRPSADSKREAILTEARKLFVQQGFAGTSMADIAHNANVPKSLLFHHFENKQTLWQLVKHDIVKNIVHDGFQFNTQHGLLPFLTQIIELRFRAYSENPDLARLIAWQTLEIEPSELTDSATPALSPQTWEPAIVDLQKQGQLRDDISPKLIIIFIASSVSAIFTHSYDPMTLKLRTQYKEKIIDCLSKALAPIPK